MSDYRQAIVNEDGELLGYDYVYADDEGSDYYDDEYDNFDDEPDGEAADAQNDAAFPDSDLWD